MATITETKNRLSALLDQVRRGESVLVVDRGVPVARIEPVTRVMPDALDGRLARLERDGIVRRGSSPAPPLALIASPPPRPRDGVSASRALLEERSRSR